MTLDEPWDALASAFVLGVLACAALYEAVRALARVCRRSRR